MVGGCDECDYLLRGLVLVGVFRVTGEAEREREKKMKMEEQIFTNATVIPMIA